MSRRAVAAVVLGTLLCAFLAPLAAAAAPSRSLTDPTVASRTQSEDAFSETKTLTRTFVNADGSTYEFPSYRVTVNVDHTENLRGRERVAINWSGAQPSGGRAANPYGENSLNQEYPVVIMQCRGTDDSSLPAAKQLSPSTCWTVSVAQRSQVTRGQESAAWVQDPDATTDERTQLSGMTPFPGTETCPNASVDTFYTHLTPFITAKGKTYPACDSGTMPPEAAVGAAFPPAEMAAFTNEDGTGNVQFEVRSDVENESLGCSDKVACSIVVIPITGLSCDPPSDPMTLSDQACRKGGRFLPGSSNFSNEGADLAVSPALWWSPSNWKNRFSVPLTFGLPPDVCDVKDKRAPTGFYGSELLAQAALQWSPAYCLNKKRFKFQFNNMADDAGWNLMTSGEGAAAEVSSKQEEGADPVGYAPTAVTGFSIGYIIDKPNNAGEYTRLRLNARLVAKLLTQSYVGSDLGRTHPGLAKNPVAIMSDPEFVKLNPSLSTNPQEVGATLLSVSNSSDVIQQLTDYIAHDKDAMAFVHGKADPWGMVVNPSYQNLDLPRGDWPLLDDFVPKTSNTCQQQNPSVYFNQLAAPVTTMRKIAEALLDAWPNVQTRCDFDPSTQLYKLGRVDRQSYGARFMLGIVSLGDAERYGLRSAALETKPGEYVAPTNGSLSAAVKLARQKKRLGPFVLDQADVRKSGRAYPGTMVVYTAARLQHLDRETAAKVSQFIELSSSVGQKAGSGNGQLPDGFLPIRKTGVTAALYASAQDVAVAVEAQQEPDSDPGADRSGDSGGADTGGVTPPDPAPSDTDPSAAPTSSPSPSTAPEAVDMPATRAVGSNVAGGVLPMLILLGAIGCVATAVIRVAVPVLRGRR